jgi:hypothetical protein
MGADGAQVPAVSQPSVEGPRDDLSFHRFAQDVQRVPGNNRKKRGQSASTHKEQKMEEKSVNMTGFKDALRSTT